MGQLAALSLTLAVEVPAALLLLWVQRWTERAREHVRRAALVVAAGTLLTHPLAWWASHHGVDALGMSRPPWAVKAAVIEAAVIAVEAVVVARFLPLSWGRALLVATVANVASFSVGWAVG